MFFFFFKQKTAYEMRISDWSSDVCSSDLSMPADAAAAAAAAENNMTDIRTFPLFRSTPCRLKGWGRQNERAGRSPVLAARPGRARTTAKAGLLACGSAPLLRLPGSRKNQWPWSRARRVQLRVQRRH